MTYKNKTKRSCCFISSEKLRTMFARNLIEFIVISTGIIACWSYPTLIEEQETEDISKARYKRDVQDAVVSAVINVFLELFSTFSGVG